MEESFHSMTSLFAQLGLPSGPDDIRRFIESRRPVPARLALHEAEFWNPSQAGFLRESILQDSDWAEVIDALNVALRQPAVRPA